MSIHEADPAYMPLQECPSCGSIEYVAIDLAPKWPGIEGFEIPERWACKECGHPRSYLGYIREWGRQKPQPQAPEIHRLRDIDHRIDVYQSPPPPPPPARRRMTEADELVRSSSASGMMRKGLIYVLEAVGLWAVLGLFVPRELVPTLWVYMFPCYIAGNVAGWLRCRAQILPVLKKIQDRRKK